MIQNSLIERLFVIMRKLKMYSSNNYYRRVTGILLVAVIVSVTIVSCTVVPLTLFNAYTFDKDEVIAGFEKYRDSIKQVAKYLLETDYEWIVIRCDEFINNHTMFVELNNGERHDVDVGGNNNATTSISELFANEKIDIISKTNDIIDFEYSGGISSTIRGVVYPIDGTEPDEEDIQFLVDIEPLDEPNWYYYESNFEHWKSENPTERRRFNEISSINR